MSKARRIVLLGAVLLILVGLSACGHSAPGDVVARVGADPIAKTTVDHWISVLASGGAVANRSRAPYQALHQRTLSFLISSQWLLGEADELGVTASEKEAQAQLELRKYDLREDIPYEGLPQGAIPTFFATAHSHSDRLWLMKLAILTARVEKKHLEEAERKITREAITSYYNEHKPRYVSPELRDIRWIVTYSEGTLQKAVREIRAGKSFLAVAKRVSLDPPTISGMELRSAKEKDFARNIFAAKPHVVAGPFRQVQNHYMLEVTKVTAAKQQTLAQSEAAIRRQLAGHWVSTTLAEAYERKWTSRTSCHPGYVVQQCRQHPGAAA